MDDFTPQHIYDKDACIPILSSQHIISSKIRHSPSSHAQELLQPLYVPLKRRDLNNNSLRSINPENLRERLLPDLSGLGLQLQLRKDHNFISLSPLEDLRLKNLERREVARHGRSPGREAFVAHPFAAPRQVGTLVDLDVWRQGVEHVCWVTRSDWGSHKNCFGGVEAVEDFFRCWERHCW